MTLKYDLPRVLGRRVFDPLGPKRLLWRCRLCGRAFKPDSVWGHYNVHLCEERDRGKAPWDVAEERVLSFRLDLAMLRRRNRRNRKNAQRAFMDDPEWHERRRQEAKARSR